MAICELGLVCDQGRKGFRRVPGSAALAVVVIHCTMTIGLVERMGRLITKGHSTQLTRTRLEYGGVMLSSNICVEKRGWGGKGVRKVRRHGYLQVHGAPLHFGVPKTQERGRGE